MCTSLMEATHQPSVLITIIISHFTEVTKAYGAEIKAQVIQLLNGETGIPFIAYYFLASCCVPDTVQALGNSSEHTLDSFILCLIP